MLYKFLFALAFLLYITNAQDDLDDDLSNPLDDINDDFGDVALASAEAASLFSTTSDSIDGTASTQDSIDGTGSAESTGSAEVTSSGDDDDEDDSFDPTDFSIDATDDSDDTSDDDFEVTADSNDDDDSTADDDDDSNDIDDDSNLNEESDDGAASLDDETDDLTNDVTSEDGDASADIDIEEECAALDNVEDCRDDIDDDGDQLCAYSETDGCYAIVRRAGRNGQGTFDQGFEKAMSSAQDKSTALYTVVGVLAGVIGALLIVIVGGAYYMYNKSQKTDHMTAVEFVEQGNIVEIDDTTPIYTH